MESLSEIFFQVLFSVLVFLFGVWVYRLSRTENEDKRIRKIVGIFCMVGGFLALCTVPATYSPQSDLGNASGLLAVGLTVVGFYLGALLLVFFGILSIIRKETLVKSVGPVYGVAGVLGGIAYTFIGLSFLFFLLTFTYEGACEFFHLQNDCSDNYIQKIWYATLDTAGYLVVFLGEIPLSWRRSL